MTKNHQQNVDHISFIKTSSMAPSSCCPDTNGVPCKEIRHAAARRHLECVKHFWGLRNTGGPDEELLEKHAISAALLRKDVAILEYLLSRNCPWDQLLVDSFFSFSHTTHWAAQPGQSMPLKPGAEWHDLYDLAFKYKLTGSATNELLLAFMNEGQWDFLEKICEYGHTLHLKEVHTWRLALNGANVAALKELHVRKAFRTADLSWLTPAFAVGVNDLALLNLACELHPAQVAAAKALAENPVMREWLNKRFNNEE